MSIAYTSSGFFTVGETPATGTVKHADIVDLAKDYVNRGGLSRKAIFYAVDESLRRLGTSYIDLLQIHRFDPNTSIEERRWRLCTIWSKVARSIT